MKTRVLLSMMALGLFLSSLAQNTIELTFTGQEESTPNHVSMDSIFIRNISQGIDTMLAAGDTTLLLNLITGIGENRQENKHFILQQNYPNPFRDRTTFAVSAFQKEDLKIQLYDLYGQKLTELKGTFEAGTHLFTLTGNHSKFYLLTVTGQSHSASIKLINSHPMGGPQHSITYSGNQPIEAYYKVTMAKNGFPYTIGDDLLFVGYAEGYEFSVIEDSPDISEDYTFEFELMDTFVCGESFTDERDGNIYQTIQIDRQCWMTENMNLGELIQGSEEQQDNETFEKYCYNDNEANCNNFGGLYQWDEMMQYDTAWSNQGICPEGWHLPTIAEWNTLIDHYGGPAVAGDSLKLGGISGFDALMAGSRNIGGGFTGLNEYASFWSSIYLDNDNSYYHSIPQSGSGITTESIEKQYGHSVRCIKGLSIIMDSMVTVIDTNIYTLISDSLELSQGIYKYHYTDKKQANDIVVENTIIGHTDFGYLRKVNSISDEPPILTLYTSQASFEDIYTQGDFSMTFNIDSLVASKLSESIQNDNNLKDKIEVIYNKENGIELIFDNLDLIIEPEYSVKILGGSLSFHPILEHEFKINLFGIRKLYFKIGGTIEHSLLLEVETSNQVNVEYIKDIFPIVPPIPFNIPGTPIIGDIGIELSAVFACESQTTFLSTNGYEASHTFAAGFLYQNGVTTPISQSENNIEFQSSSLESEGSLMLKAAIGPKVYIRFFKVVGPYVFVGPYANYIYEIDGISLNRNHELNAGIEVNIGVSAEIFGFTLASYNANIPLAEWNIWEMPNGMIEISGNNQIGNTNTQLPVPIKIQVLDKWGLPAPFIPVHFEVIEGNGSLSEYTVYTDFLLGMAETYWTLGPEAGENKLIAKVQKADGTHIDGSPMEFMATATTGGGDCPSTITDIDGNTYNTVQIGSQCWMKENLKTTTYNNGTAIPNETNASNWSNLTSGAYVWYSNDISWKDSYGALYNWYATADANGLCPTGWHVPTNDEWTVLTDYIGGTASPHGNELKSCRQVNSPLGGGCNTSEHPRWNSNSSNWGTDDYGFSGLPGGYRSGSGTFDSIGNAGSWWSSSEGSSGYAWYRRLGYDYGPVSVSSNYELNGFSVRCLRDF